jgi:hypothetical protein
LRYHLGVPKPFNAKLDNGWLARLIHQIDLTATVTDSPGVPRRKSASRPKSITVNVMGFGRVQ